MSRHLRFFAEGRSLGTALLATVLAVTGCTGPGGSDGSSGSSSAAIQVGVSGEACSNAPFGAAQGFTLFVSGNLEQSNSDIEGRTAAGGKATLANETIGAALTRDAARADLVVAGDLFFLSGSVPNGRVEVGGTTSATSHYFFGGAQTGVSSVDFTATAAAAQALSAYFALYAPNGTVELPATGSGHEIRLTGTNPLVNAFSLDASDFTGATGLRIEAPAGASVVVNVSGTSATIANFAFTYIGTDPKHTLFNFPNATSLTLNQIGFDGSILAPNAAITFPNGRANGQIFAASFSGQGQLNLANLAVCLPIGTITPPGLPTPPTPPAPACTVDGDCSSGFYCDSGTCVANPPPSTPACLIDTDCSSGFYCSVGTCLPLPPTPACVLDTDCSSGYYCSVGTCTALPPTGSTCSTTALGSAADFNLFLSGDFTHTNSDLEGRAAIGGNATLQNWSVGSSLPNDASRLDLVVAGNLSLTNGEASHGAGMYAGTGSITSGTFFGGLTHGASPINFTTEFASLTTLSSYLATQASNGTVDITPWNAITLTGTDSTLNVFTIASSSFNGCVGLTINAPAGSTVLVNITGTSLTLQNFQTFFNGTNREHTFYNLADATTLTIQSFGVHGSILAPHAAVSFNNGQLNGHLIAASMSGYGELHQHPFAGCLPTPGGSPPPPPPPPTVVCTSNPFGAANGFNLFVGGDFTHTNSDLEGRAAAGGNALLQNWSVGSSLPNNASRLDLVVGGNLSLTNGEASHGAGLYVGTGSITSGTFFGGLAHGPSPINFSSTMTELATLSATGAAQASNGTVDITPWGAITLTGTDASLNVFSIAASSFNGCTGLTINAPAGSSVLVNITGTSLTLQNFQTFFNGTDREHTLYNLPSATTLIIQSFGVHGSVLAPSAAVSFNNGQLNGELFAATFSGTGELHEHPFADCALLFGAPPDPQRDRKARRSLPHPGSTGTAAPHVCR